MRKTKLISAKRKEKLLFLKIFRKLKVRNWMRKTQEEEQTDKESEVDEVIPWKKTQKSTQQYKKDSKKIKQKNI